MTREVRSEDAFFRTGRGTGEQELLIPLPLAQGGWGATMRGMAVAGALARAAEQAAEHDGLAGFVPARWTVELLRPAGMVPSVATAWTMRRGGRAGVIDAELRQGDVLVGRATALYLRTGETPVERVWEADNRFMPPPPGVLPCDGDRRVFHTPGAGWSTELAAHQTAERKQVWCGAIPIVAGKAPTPFQFVGSVADVASVAVNWGDTGLQHINADISVHLARLPLGGELGMVAIERAASSGLSSGTVSLFDRRGIIGTVSVSALANAVRAVNVGEWAPTSGPAPHRSRTKE
jgi:hypothetical protein